MAEFASSRLRSPTDVAATSAAAAAESAARPLADTMSDNNSDSDSAELLRLGLLDGAFGNVDLDIASSFAGVAADDSKRTVLSTSGDVDLPATSPAPGHHPSSKTAKRRLQRSRDAAALPPTASDTATAALSTLELRRKRNRDSMRRARDRQRSEHAKLERAIEQLEDRLERLLRVKETSASDGATAYSHLLRETEALRDEHDRLSEHVRQHAHFQSRIDRLAALEQQAQQHADDDASADAAVLAPLLQWVTPEIVTSLVHYARDQLLQVADVTNTLVPTSQSILGWHAKRTLHANWGHYTMCKSFARERPAGLAQRTWECTVNSDVDEMQRVLPWTYGTKVLHRLSDDAIVIARDMNVPNLEDLDHPIRIRYILLVFRTPLDSGGCLVGTVTLNVYGTSVDECLAQRVSHQHGMRALTMYAFIFTRIQTGASRVPRASDSATTAGCTVTLAGRSGDGSLTYARKVLFEVLPSILRWENTFVAPILRVAG